MDVDRKPFPWSVAVAATLVLFLDLTATTVIVPLLPTYDLSEGQTSVVFLAKPAAEMLSNLLSLGPGLADFVGPKRPAVAGMVMVAAGGAMLTTSSFELLAFARIFGGLGASLAVPAALDLVAVTFDGDPEARDSVVSLALAGDALGGVVGPVLGSALYYAAHSRGASVDTSRGAAVFTVSALCLVCVLLLLLEPDRRPAEVSEHGEAPLSTWEVATTNGVGAVAVAALAFGATSFQIGALESTTPRMLVGYGDASSGYFWALVGLGFCLAAPFGSRLMSWVRAPPRCCPACATRPLDKTTSQPREEGPLGSPSLRHAWLSVAIGFALLLTYSVLLEETVRVHLPSASVESGGPAPPKSFLGGFCLAMLLLGVGLGFVYVPLNTYTQDLTLALLNQTALARSLGFLQGAKNLGLVLGYVVGPAVLGSYEKHDEKRGFVAIAGILAAESVVVGCAALALRMRSAKFLESHLRTWEEGGGGEPARSLEERREDCHGQDSAPPSSSSSAGGLTSPLIS